MIQDLKLVKKEEDCFDAEYTYEYKGYTIKDAYFSDEDCNHHNAIVYLNGKELIQYNYGDCFEKAIAYVDALVKRNEKWKQY